jgi:ABC-type Zn uptake system ZnuABC Zn-binding protein ZnuA
MVSIRPGMSILRLACLAGALCAAAVSLRCGGSGDAPEPGRISVVATTVEIGALTRAVAGDAVQLTVLAPSGVDPHDFEPRASGLRTLEGARVVLRNGLGLDDWLDSVLGGDSGDRVVVVTEGIRVRHSRSGESAATVDPHAWHDPTNARVMVQNIAAALIRVDSGNAGTYRENADAYARRLDEVDREIRGIIDGIPAENRKMVTDHDAFGYLIDRYGLTFVGAVIPSTSTSAEASARHVAELQDTIRREGVKAIFAERTADPKVARQVARDTGVKVVDTLYGDSLGEPGSGQETVDGMLLFNARTIAEALK